MHDRLIFKRPANGFDFDALVFIESYLSERQQKTKAGHAYSTYSDILYGVPQGSILDPLLFNIYISDMFCDIENCDTASYADNSTPYTSDFNLEEVIQKLELNTKNLFEWLKNNHMKASADKCHLLVTRDTDVTVKTGEFDIKNSAEEKLFGVKIDNKLSFKNHAFFLCEKAISQKLHALAKVINFMDLAERMSLMKAFITSQLNYCPLIWMFHKLNNRINKIHKRALKLVYKDNKLSFNDLLELDNSVTIHQRNLQILATEIFKVKNSLAPESNLLIMVFNLCDI